MKVTALLGDGTQLQLDLVLTPGDFENEPCVRIMVPARKRDDRQGVFGVFRGLVAGGKDAVLGPPNALVGVQAFEDELSGGDD